MKLLVLNGPNLNFLGIREKGIYGTEDYGALVRMLKEKAEREGHELDIYQSNYEGGLIDRIQEAYYNGTEGIVINPGRIYPLQLCAEGCAGIRGDSEDRGAYFQRA